MRREIDQEVCDFHTWRILLENMEPIYIYKKTIENQKKKIEKYVCNLYIGGNISGI